MDCRKLLLVTCALFTAAAAQSSYYKVNFGSAVETWDRHTGNESLNDGVSIIASPTNEQSTIYQPLNIVPYTPIDPEGANYTTAIYEDFLTTTADQLTISFDVIEGVDYTCVLHFFETRPELDWSVINVEVNGITAATNLQIPAITGGIYKPLALTIRYGILEDPTFDITISKVDNDIAIWAVELFPTGAYLEPAEPPAEPPSAPVPPAISPDEETTIEAPATGPAAGPEAESAVVTTAVDAATFTGDIACVQAEEAYCKSESGTNVKGLFVLEKGPQYKGCGTLRWTTENYYGQAKVKFPEYHICYKFDLPQAGTYKVRLTGDRVTMGRTPVTCGESLREKEVDKAACLAENNNECVCNDEENDFWTFVTGTHVQLGVVGTTPFMSAPWLKHMMNCAWDKPCDRDVVNVDHGFLKAEYSMAEGINQVCVGGRSLGASIDQVCLIYQGPATVAAAVATGPTAAPIAPGQVSVPPVGSTPAAPADPNQDPNAQVDPNDPNNQDPNNPNNQEPNNQDSNNQDPNDPNNQDPNNQDPNDPNNQGAGAAAPAAGTPEEQRAARRAARRARLQEEDGAGGDDDEEGGDAGGEGLTPAEAAQQARIEARQAAREAAGGAGGGAGNRAGNGGGRRAGNGGETEQLAFAESTPNTYVIG